MLFAKGTDSTDLKRGYPKSGVEGPLYSRQRDHIFLKSDTLDSRISREAL